MYLCDKLLEAFLKSIRRIRDSSFFLFVLDKIRNVDDTEAYDIAFYVGLLLLPNYFTNQWPEPLSDTARGKLVAYRKKGDWSVVSSQGWIFLSSPQQSDDACFKRRGESSIFVALIDGI